MYRLALVACVLLNHTASGGDVYVLKPDGKVEKAATAKLKTCDCCSPGCACATLGKEKDCNCYPCKCNAPLSYADGFKRVSMGQTLLLAVGVKAKKGEVQGDEQCEKFYKPGVYKWYLHQGQPCVDAAPKVKTVAETGPQVLTGKPLVVPLRFLDDCPK